jgi:hypothetical protein
MPVGRKQHIPNCVSETVLEIYKVENPLHSLQITVLHLCIKHFDRM